MNKKIFAVTLAAVLFAAGNVLADGLGLDYDFKENFMIIGGKQSAVNEFVSVILINTDNEKPYFISQGRTGLDGGYEFKISLDLLDDGTYEAVTNVGGKEYTASKYYKASLRPSESGSGGNGSSKPSSSNSGKNNSSVYVPVIDTSAVPDGTAAATMGGFDDVPITHWAYNAIKTLTGRGIITGLGDNKYGPDDNLTREQFAKLLIDTMKLDLLDDDIDHTDVNKGAWSYPYLVAVYKYGIMEGYSDATLGPRDNITRQDLAVLVSRALEVKSITVQSGSNADFSDSADISEYALESVWLLYNAGIITGMDDGSFMPKSCVTRAQAAVILEKVLSVMGG